MRVLLTNNALDQSAGTELYVRDLAIELMRRGHSPVAYSTKLGCVADELVAAGVPVVRSLEAIGEAPDIIHGHHHYETLTALLGFPRTPAIYYCHGSWVWQEAPLKHPRILRYVAVDEPCRERLMVEGGIPDKQIDLIWNFFDRRRFPPRAQLPPKPKLALAFSNTFSEKADLPVLRQACAQCGIELHAVGLGAGNPSTQPGQLLCGYDVVFAKARAAIEAMAVGAAVVLCNPGHLGPLVTTGNFDWLRRLNFGARAQSRPLEVESLVAELRRFDPDDATRVACWTREKCELQAAVDRILELYGQVVDEARRHPVTSTAEGDQAVSRYLEQWASRYKETAAGAEKVLADLDRAESQLSEMRASATWRWSQNVLGSWPVRRVLGGLVRSVAKRAQSRSQTE